MIEVQSEVALLKAQVSNMENSKKKAFFNVVGKKHHKCFNCIITYEEARGDSHNAFNLNKGTFRAPSTGHYLFSFHALVETGHEAQVEIVINGESVAHLYDRDPGSYNKRYAMIGQTIIHNMNEGEEAFVRLHKGGIRGGNHGDSTFLSFVGVQIDTATNDANAVDNTIF